MVSLTIDGKTIGVPAGTTILEAARQAGIIIPTLCWLEKVSPTGACRICVVEVGGIDQPQTACNTPVKEGIAVTTESERLTAIRRQVVQLLLVNHPLDCPVCDAGGECDLQDVCYALDVDKQRFEAEDVTHPPIESWPLIQQVPSRCILCEKCVKVCHEVVGASALVIRENGERAFIDTVDGQPLNCEFCGNCVGTCPTGTLLSKPFKFKARPWELTRIPSICTYCGSNCQIDYNVKHDQVVRVTSADGVTANDGNLCIGGFFGYGYIDSPQRLQAPRLRSGDSARQVGWSEALAAVTSKLRGVIAGPGAAAIAGLASPRLTNEENYLFQKLFRVAIGSNNIDSEARFGALRALRTLDAALGLKGASNRIDRISRSEAVLVFGCDATAEAPMIDWAIEQACRKRDGKLVVANMREVKLTRYAETFLNYRPGSEVDLANALVKLIVEQNLADDSFLQRYVKNLPEMTSHLAAIDLQQAAEKTGLPLVLLEEAARHLGKAGSVAVVFGPDITRSENAEAKIQAIANLALVTGALNGDLGGLFPVDEKGNMQGLLDMGVCPELLPGHQDYQSARSQFQNAWGVDLPTGGRDALGILEGIEKGEIKVLYLVATNPLVSFPDSGRWRKALAKVEYLIVQDILSSELTDLAHVVLPGTSSAEKSGSYTSLDHRVSCLRPAVSPRGESREDWSIFADLFQQLLPKARTFDVEGVLAEMKSLVPLYTAVCFETSGRCRPCQKELYQPVEKELLYSPVNGSTAAEGPQLLTGKILYHFGTTSTFADANLEVAPAGYIEMNPADAQTLGIKEGGTVRVTSVTGAAQGPVRLSTMIPSGLLFAPYHFRDLNIQQIIPSGRNRVPVQINKV
ncbi:MAG: molybdopterin-dependent oxidoreductase [Desulfuromonadales bacterium]|nr:molybdopterin-dependent oxidoreductase [Desulfuromonadales bacterium]